MENKLRAGEVTALNVARLSEFGYFLSNGTEDVMLHKREASRELKEGETVDVFYIRIMMAALRQRCHSQK